MLLYGKGGKIFFIFFLDKKNVNRRENVSKFIKVKFFFRQNIFNNIQNVFIYNDIYISLMFWYFGLMV